MTEFAPGRWQGQWIWSPRTAHIPETDPFRSGLDPDYYDRRVLFRREFELTEVPAHAPYRITADSRYVLWVNGVELHRGPLRHGPRQLCYDQGDAAPALRTGRNVVAVTARFFGRPNAWWVPAPTTLTLGGGSLVAELRLGERWLVTDERWRCLDPTAWTGSLPADTVSAQLVEIFDARALDPAWTDAGYDDSAWEPVRVLAELSHGGAADARPPSEPFGAIAPSPLPAPTPTPVPARWTAERTTAYRAGEPGALTAALAEAVAVTGAPVDASAEHDLTTGPLLIRADFGAMTAGQLRLQLSAHGEVVVDGALSELPGGQPNPAAATTLATAAAFRYTAREGVNTFVREDPSGGQSLVAAVYGTGRVRLSGIAMIERLRPRPAGPDFAAADPELDRLYAVGARTVDLTAQDAYLDCPSREQRAWTGDSVVHQSVDLVTNPDWSLARWNPRLLAQPRSDGMLPMVGVGDFADPDRVAIPDWALHWVRSVHNLYRYTGDRELVGQLLPAAELALRWFCDFRGPDGLLHDVTGWVLIDWAPVPVRGASASLNALWGRGLVDFADMADWLGDSGRADWAREQHRALAAGFERFWDADRGAYREQLRPGAAVTEHAHAAAVCADLVSADRLATVLALLLDRDQMVNRATFLQSADSAGVLPSPEQPDWDTDALVVAAQPFYRYVVHDALARLGAAGTIATLVRDWLPLLAGAPSAFREVWQGGSYAHGWSATPTRDLIVYTLGVSPGEPGYATVRVAPQPGELAWVRGTVPTPHGPVSVSVQGDRVHVESPVSVELVARDGSVERHPAGTVEGRI